MEEKHITELDLHLEQRDLLDPKYTFERRVNKFLKSHSKGKQVYITFPKLDTEMTNSDHINGGFDSTTPLTKKEIDSIRSEHKMAVGKYFNYVLSNTHLFIIKAYDNEQISSRTKNYYLSMLEGMAILKSALFDNTEFKSGEELFKTFILVTNSSVFEYGQNLTELRRRSKQTT